MTEEIQKQEEDVRLPTLNVFVGPGDQGNAIMATEVAIRAFIAAWEANRSNTASELITIKGEVNDIGGPPVEMVYAPEKIYRVEIT